MPSKLKSDIFFRLILADKINLRIPTKFIIDHRKNILLNDALLTVSDNNVWLMSLTVSGDGFVWLDNGWPEFTQHYRLDTGHMLLFKHLGKSIFHVTMFDQTCCEINYTSPTKPPKSNIEIDRFATQDHLITPMEVDTGDQETEDLAGKQRTKNRAFELAKSFKSDLAGKQRTENRAFELAQSFKSDKPFYSITINSSYIQSWGLYVPVGFLRRYLTNGDKTCVYCVLEVSDGTKWGPIMCRDYITYGKMYGDNWKKFRDDNNLAIGDVCVFELIDEVEKVLKVNIFRYS